MRSVAFALACLLQAEAAYSQERLANPLAQLLLALRSPSAARSSRQLPRIMMAEETGERRDVRKSTKEYLGDRSIGRQALVRSTLFAASTLATSLLTSPLQPAVALGDQTIGLTVQNYKEVSCPPELAQGRAGGALGAGAGGSGIAQKCVEVEADLSNPRKETVKDAAVYGNVYEKSTSMSVLGNGQDGKNDAGQFAMIPSVPPGESKSSFIFVAQQEDSCRPTRKRGDDGKVFTETCPIQGTKPLVELRFDKMKAVAYPGGERFKLYDECEQNPFAEGCE